MTLRGCPHCGLVQHVPNVEPGHEALCARCGDTVYRPDGMLSNRLCAAFALAALICYPLGVTLPVMRLEQLGHVRDASIWDGTISLLTHGYIVIGLIVLICSVVVPILKVAGLFVLTARPAKLREHHQARVYRLIELAGRWGMVADAPVVNTGLAHGILFADAVGTVLPVQRPHRQRRDHLLEPRAVLADDNGDATLKARQMAARPRISLDVLTRVGDVFRFVKRDGLGVSRRRDEQGA